MQWQSRRQSKRGIKLYEELYKLLSMIGLESEPWSVKKRLSALDVQYYILILLTGHGVESMSFHLLPFVFTVVSWEEKEPMH